MDEFDIHSTLEVETAVYKILGVCVFREKKGTKSAIFCHFYNDYNRL